MPASRESPSPLNFRWYIYGIVKYRDIFAGTKVHKTKFCYMLNVTKDWDGQTPPAYSLCSNWNCADETCVQDRLDFESAIKEAFANAKLEVPSEIKFLLDRSRQLDPD